MASLEHGPRRGNNGNRETFHVLADRLGEAASRHPIDTSVLRSVAKEILDLTKTTVTKAEAEVIEIIADKSLPEALSMLRPPEPLTDREIAKRLGTPSGAYNKKFKDYTSGKRVPNTTALNELIVGFDIGEDSAVADVLRQKAYDARSKRSRRTWEPPEDSPTIKK